MSKNLEKDYDSDILTNHYNVLNIEPIATTKEIKKAYMILAKQHHPDHGGNSKIFEKITEAYEVLSNNFTRKEYDLKLGSNNNNSNPDSYLQLKTEWKNYVLENNIPTQQINNIYDSMFETNNDTNDSSTFDSSTNLSSSSNFMFSNSSTCKLTQKQLDDMYTNTFVTQTVKPESIEKFNINLSDIENERNIYEIENDDLRIKNIVTNNKNITVSDIFDYISHTKENTNNTNNKNSHKEIIEKNTEIKTLDTLNGYFNNNCSLFIDPNNNFGNFSNGCYSEINSLQPKIISNDLDNINIDSMLEWKKNKKNDNKLTEKDINRLMNERKEENEKIKTMIKSNLKSNVRETQRYLQINDINDINEQILRDDVN